MANKITPKDMELLVGALKHSNNFKLDTDWTAFNKEFGYNSENTARVRVGQVIRKLREAANDTSTNSEVKEPQTPKKARAPRVAKTPASKDGKRRGKRLLDPVEDDNEMPIDDEPVMLEKKQDRIKQEEITEEEEEDNDEQYA